MVAACACGGTLTLLAFREKAKAETDEATIVTFRAAVQIAPQFLSEQLNDKRSDPTELVRDRAPASSIPDLTVSYGVSVLDMVFFGGVRDHAGGNAREDYPVVALLVDESGESKRADGGDSERCSATVRIRLYKWSLSGDRAIRPLAW